MYLFFDTETTGLPKNWNSPVEDVDNWPRMVQLAFIHADINGNTLSEHNYIITPDGYEIPKEISEIHGITTEIANKNGIEIGLALSVFKELANWSNYLVAHNISFDKKIIGAEFIRNGDDYSRKIQTGIAPDIMHICTMKSTIDFVGIKNINGVNKFPKLKELHLKLFNEDFDNAHNALADVKATARCFFELKKLNLI